jgi:RNA polymerase sigma-70 factor (ECF subfamily)
VREASAIKRRSARAEAASLESPVGETVSHETSFDLWRALATLPTSLREVVVLRYFEDLSSREIGAILRLPPGTVRFRLSRAMHRLRPLLGDVPVATSTHRHATFEVRPHAV